MSRIKFTRMYLASKAGPSAGEPLSRSRSKLGRHLLGLVAVISSAITLTGCGGGGGDDRPETVNIGGVVTLDGTPVEKALVTFKAQGRDGKGASASTDADGRYSIGVFGPGTGVLPDTYKITVTKFDQSAGGGEIAPDSDSEDYDPLSADAPPDTSEPKNELPEQYADESTTPLSIKAELGADNDDFNLELSSS